MFILPCRLIFCTIFCCWMIQPENLLNNHPKYDRICLWKQREKSEPIITICQRKRKKVNWKFSYQSNEDNGYDETPNGSFLNRQPATAKKERNECREEIHMKCQIWHIKTIADVNFLLQKQRISSMIVLLIVAV